MKRAYFFPTFICCLLCLSNSFAQTIYSENFDVDPLWITDQPENFMWNEQRKTFVARTFSGVPNYTPNRYAYKDINLDVSKFFSFSWDQRIIERQGNAISHFGLMASDLIVGRVTFRSLPRIIPKSAFNGALGGAFSGQSYRFNVHTSNGLNSGQGGFSIGLPGGGEVGPWFSNTISYDPVSSEVAWLLQNRETNETIFNIVRPIGGEFSSDMTRIGIGNDPIGYHPNLVWAINPNDYQITEYDNIGVTGQLLTQSAPSFSFPLYGSDPILVNTIAGGTCFRGPNCFNENHSSTNAFYSVDFDVNVRTPAKPDSAFVVAAGEGKVVAIGGKGKCSDNNNCLVIDHGNGYFTEYRELTTVESFSIGDRVEENQLLGTIVAGAQENNSGNPDHLHFQVLYDVDGTGKHLDARSDIHVGELASVTVGGKRLTEILLSPNGTQGKIGLVAARGDVTSGNNGVFEKVGFNNVVVGELEPGNLIINGPVEYQVDGAFVVGKSANGSTIVTNGAGVSAKEIRVGEDLNGNGILTVSGANTYVRATDFIGIGVNGPFSTPEPAGVGRIEVLNGASLTAPVVGVFKEGWLQVSNGTLNVDDVIIAGGGMGVGLSPGTAMINGDFRFESGHLELEVENGISDKIIVSGSITIGPTALFDLFFDVLPGSVNIADYFDGNEPRFDPAFTYSNIRAFTSDDTAVGSMLNVLFGGQQADIFAQARSPSPVPLPGALPLFLAALLVLGWSSWRQRNN